MKSEIPNLLINRICNLLFLHFYFIFLNIHCFRSHSSCRCECERSFYPPRCIRVLVLNVRNASVETRKKLRVLSRRLTSLSSDRPDLRAGRAVIGSHLLDCPPSWTPGRGFDWLTVTAGWQALSVRTVSFP